MARLRSYQENLNQLLAYCRKTKSFDSLEEAELLSIYLQSFSRRKDTRALCRRMLYEAGSLYNLVHLPTYKIERRFGVSNIISTAIANLGVTAKHIQMRTQPHDTLNTLPLYYDHLKPYFSECFYETSVIVCLDKKDGWIASETATFFDPRQSPASSKLILETALRYRASQIVLAHNHPNSTAQFISPSVSDISATESIRSVLAVYDILLKDHILMAHDGCCSVMYDSEPYLDPHYHPNTPISFIDLTEYGIK